MGVTEEQEKTIIECSTERHAAKDFPEYASFFTGTVEYRKSRIINSIKDQEVDVLAEAMSGGLGDVIDAYIKLRNEERFDASFLGKITRAFRYKRYSWDRNYLLSRLKHALNHILLRW